MNRAARFLTVFVLFLVAVHIGVAETPADGALDGKTFEVTMAGGGEESSDTLIFADGTFDSVECRQYGFGAVPYHAEKKEGDSWGFSAEARSEKEGVSRWKGTVTGNEVRGTMEWIKEGQETIRYKFHGKTGS